jgi:hypothetical protein
MLDGNRVVRIRPEVPMEKTSPEQQRSPSTVPLARAPDGNFIEVPAGAVGWRVRRQTGGRPRLHLDARKQPMLFPLDYTIADVEDILAPGSYLLDVIDKDGELLGVTIAVSIGMPRNAESVEPDNDNVDSAPMMVPTTLPNTTSDVRLVLEANVRATQMAFIHNQRTLEIGLRMAETLRDSVQLLASSQADWIKSISSARGFFRNAGQPLAPVEVKQLTVTTGSGDEDDENDDSVTDDGHDGGDGGDGGGDGGADDNGGSRGEGSPSKAQHWSEAWLPVVNHVLMQVMPMVNVWAENQKAEARARRAGATTKEVADVSGAHASADEPAAVQAKHARAEQLAAAVAAASSPGRGVDVMKLLQLLPPETSAKLMKIQMALLPDEQADGMKILKGFPVEELQDLLATFDVASLDECTDFLRRLIHDWRKTQAARRARATEPRPADHVGDGDAIANTVDPRTAYAASREALRAAQAEQERAAQEHAAQLASAIATASSPGPGINVFSLLRLLPPYTASKLVHINAALSPEEQADAMQVLKSYSVEAMHELLAAFDANPVEECTAFLRRVIADWRAHHAAELARTKEAPRGGSGMSGAAGPISAARSSGTSGAAGPISAAGASSPSHAAAPSGATGMASSTVAVASIGASGAVGSSTPSRAADPSGATGPSETSHAAGSSSAEGPSSTEGPSSAEGSSSAIAPSHTSGAPGRGGSGSKKPR